MSPQDEAEAIAIANYIYSPPKKFIWEPDPLGIAKDYVSKYIGRWSRSKYACNSLAAKLHGERSRFNNVRKLDLRWIIDQEIQRAVREMIQTKQLEAEMARV